MITVFEAEDLAHQRLQEYHRWGEMQCLACCSRRGDHTPGSRQWERTLATFRRIAHRTSRGPGPITTPRAVDRRFIG